MRMDRLTTLAQEILAGAQSLAMSKSHAEMSPLHILAAMFDARESVAHSILDKSGFDSDRIAQIATSEVNRKPTISSGGGASSASR